MWTKLLRFLEDIIFSGIKERQVYLSGSQDPGVNLSLEEELYENLPPGVLRCLLYINRPSVVIGRHQNPWKEIRLDRMRERGIRFYRRISGGGTVYHDLGNLNFSFLLPQSSYEKEVVSRTVLDFLETLGIAGEVNHRGDLLLDGKKFSGNAYRVSRGKVLHHGTLLVNADLAGLKGMLGSMPGSFETRAVASVPSPVVNLESVQEGLTAMAVISKWGQWWQDKGAIVHPPGWEKGLEKQIIQRLERHDEADWLYGETPKFEYFPSSGGSVLVRDGQVISAQGILDGIFIEGKAFRLEG